MNERMCIVCRQMKPKNELIRVCKFEDCFKIDYTGKMNGRGAYICDSDDCIEKACKKKVLNRAFKCAVTEDIYNSLKDAKNDK